MKIQFNHNSLFSSLTYRFGSTLIDPGDEWRGFAAVGVVLLTHAHFDHIYGLNRLLELNPSALVYTNLDGREALLNDKKNMSRYHESPFIFNFPDSIRLVTDGEIVHLGESLSAEAHFTPGHNPSCITWVVGDAVFSGDAYIPGIRTVTNLPGSDKDQALRSEILIKSLAEGKQIYPGHKI